MEADELGGVKKRKRRVELEGEVDRGVEEEEEGKHRFKENQQQIHR